MKCPMASKTREPQDCIEDKIYEHTCPKCNKNIRRLSINSQVLCNFCGHWFNNPLYKE